MFCDKCTHWIKLGGPLRYSLHKIKKSTLLPLSLFTLLNESVCLSITLHPRFKSRCRIRVLVMRSVQERTLKRQES